MMASCSSCGAAIATFSRYCSSCGAEASTPTSTPTELESDETALAPESLSSDGSRPLHASGTASSRFAAGTILGERYRIVGLLGRGGMGEVYRADDLTLDQPVALKFLPAEMVASPSRRQRFLSEVRVARQVAHPNVCRVFDIGEVDDHYFISMELVQGDDMVTLLRQVGRFPEEKALEIARQICAGLAAAHDRGIIHRDLKPANVMIDAEGRVRITDFGLAALVGEVEGHDIGSGTPTYMAPEQLAGREVTESSDIYALGLVLYELFTGNRALDAGSMAELQSLHEGGLTRPSSHVRDLDPGIESVILRCLANDPQGRPASALAVAAALPGGDPLAAALAAGETPSPEMVAAAGAEGTLAPKVAGLLAGGTLFLLLVAALLGSFQSAATVVGFDKPASFLEQKAKEIVEELAFDVEVVDEASSTWIDGDYLRYQEEQDDSAERWEDLASGRHENIYVWYRRSPRPLVARAGFTVVGPANPPMQHSGEAIAWLDVEGRLARFESIPPQFVDDENREEVLEAFDWSRLFEEAGLDWAAFEPTPSTWTPPMSSDERRAWKGPHPGLPETELRVEAATFHGRPVYFRVIAPWTRPERMQAREQSLSEKISQVGGLVLMVVALAVGILLARRNLILGRGDQRGAFKVAFWYLMAHTLVWLLWADHVADFGMEWRIVQLDVGYNLFLTAMLWIFYVALEPYIRRRWPDTLIGWSRLLAGRFRDPLVGRDILVGGCVGAAILLFSQAGSFLPILLGWAPPMPRYPNWPEGGFPEIVGNLLDLPVHALLAVMQVLLIVLVIGVVARKKWITVTLCTAILTVLSAGNAHYPALDIPVAAVSIAAFFYLLGWHGLIASTVALMLLNGMQALPLSTDFGAWYQGYPLAAFLTITALMIFAYRTATDGEPLLRDELLAPEDIVRGRSSKRSRT